MAAILGAAYKKARSLDREATHLIQDLGRLPSSHPLRQANFPAEHRQLQSSLRALETEAKKYMKELPKGGIREAEREVVGKLSGDAPTLHAKLDELDVALDSWMSHHSQNRMMATGHSKDPRVDVSVDHASAAFENFRAGGARGPFGHGNGRDGQVAKPDGARLLRVLHGFSPWSESTKVQELLQRRQDFLDYRFNAGRQFLDEIKDKRRYPEAEKYARGWQRVTESTLGQFGCAEWRDRASRMHMKQSHRGVADAGVLRIRNLRAYNLRSADLWDQSDPFIDLFFAGEHRRTSVVMNNEKNPEWDEEIHFDVKSLRRSPVLGVHLFDWDWISSNDSLGMVNEGGGGLDLLALFERRHPRLRPHGADVLQKERQERATAKHNEKQHEQFKKAGGQGAAHPPPKARPGSCAMELFENGSVVFHTGLIQLQPDPNVDYSYSAVSGSIEFEICYDAIGGDPLVIQPEHQDGALHLFAQVEHHLGRYEEEFAKASEGFFLGPMDANVDGGFDRPSFAAMDTVHSVLGSLGINTGGRTPGTHLAHSMKQEVWHYNQTLDVLNVLTSERETGAVEVASIASPRTHGGWGHAQAHAPQHGVSNRDDISAFAGMLAAPHWSALTLDQQQQASERFLKAVSTIRHVERDMHDNPAKRRVFAFQDDFLPQIGVWSTDRRRKLRDQVYRASLRVDMHQAEKLRRHWCSIAMMVLFVLALIGLLVYGIAGGEDSWKHAGVTAAVLVVIAVICLCCAYARRMWPFDKQRGASLFNWANPHISPRGQYAKVIENHVQM